MALTPSNMLALGTQAPDFLLPDAVSDKNLSYDEIAGSNGTLLMFICNHCPYVVHINDELVRLGEEYAAKGIGIAAISANDAQSYPADAPDQMRAKADELGYPFPYLYDETQDVARAYEAACTPDFYLFNADKELVYRGRLDDSTPGSGKPVTGKDLRAALDALLNRKPPLEAQQPSMGCNIKWKPVETAQAFGA